MNTADHVFLINTLCDKIKSLESDENLTAADHTEELQKARQVLRKLLDQLPDKTPEPSKNGHQNFQQNTNQN